MGIFETKIEHCHKLIKQFQYFFHALGNQIYGEDEIKVVYNVVHKVKHTTRVVCVPTDVPLLILLIC